MAKYVDHIPSLPQYQRRLGSGDSDVSSTDEQLITLPGGRKGRLVAADDAGEYRTAIVGEDRLAEASKALGCTDDQVMAITRLRDLIYEVYGSAMNVGGSYGADRGSTNGGIENVINDAAYKRYREVLRWISPHHHLVCRYIADCGYVTARTNQAHLKAGIEMLVIHFERIGW